MSALLALLALTPCCGLQQPAPSPAAPTLERVAVLATAAPGAEIVSVQASSARAVLTHSATGQVELFSLADPARPRALGVIALALEEGEELTSVAFPPGGDWFLACVKARKARAPGRLVAHSLADGRLLASFPAGVGPDCVAIAKSGAYALVANEAEEFAEEDGRLVSAPGSLTLVHLAEPLASSRVVQIPLEALAGSPPEGRRIERKAKGEREIELGTTPEFLEPEVVAFVPGAERALVTLQENNAVAEIDLAEGRVTRVLALGHTTHPADLASDGRFAETGTLRARREPDGVALTPDGRFFVTADEGDTVGAPLGGSSGGGTEALPAGGGRTLSLFDLATGALLGDTGPELDRAAARAGLYPDGRSPKKGSEPEMVLTFERGPAGQTRPYAAVTLERAGAVALVDLGDPAHPVVVALAASGGAPGEDEPEGLAHYRDPASGADYLYVANEGTGTLGVLCVPR